MWMRRAAEIRSNSAQVYFRLGQVEEAQHHYYAARRDFRPALALNPDDAGMRPYHKPFQAKPALAPRSSPRGSRAQSTVATTAACCAGGSLAMGGAVNGVVENLRGEITIVYYASLAASARYSVLASDRHLRTENANRIQFGIRAADPSSQACIS